MSGICSAHKDFNLGCTICLQDALAEMTKLKDNFGPFYFRDMNEELGLPENTDLDTQMATIRKIKNALAEKEKECEKLQRLLETIYTLTHPNSR